MEDHENPIDSQRRMKNLQAVARHLAAQKTDGSEQGRKTDSGSGRASALKRWGAVGALMILCLGKLKWVVALLKLTKLSTLLTMLLAVWAYAQLWGWRFALGFVLLIFIHEMGHALAMRLVGLPAGAPVFIPFVGAVIAVKGRLKNAYEEAIIGIGGPVLGTVGAILCLLVAWQSGSMFWYALASTGFLINLFNMLPVRPLDGGRITGVVSRWLWLPGFVLGVLVFLKTHSPILVLIGILAVFSFLGSVKAGREDYYRVEPKKRLAIGAAYFVLLFVMAFFMWVADQPLKSLAA